MFFLSGFEHSLTADAGSAWARSPWERCSERPATHCRLRRTIGPPLTSRPERWREGAPLLATANIPTGDGQYRETKRRKIQGGRVGQHAATIIASVTSGVYWPLGQRRERTPEMLTGVVNGSEGAMLQPLGGVDVMLLVLVQLRPNRANRIRLERAFSLDNLRYERARGVESALKLG